MFVLYAVRACPAKMASDELANKENGETVRQELKGIREQLEATHAALDRKEVRNAFTRQHRQQR